MTLEESVARDEVIEVEFVNAPRRKELAASFQVAIAGALHVEPRTHQVVRPAVRPNVEQAHPKIRVAAVAGKIDSGHDGPGDLSIDRKRLGIEGENVGASRELAIVVRSRCGISVAHRIRRVRDKGCELLVLAGLRFTQWRDVLTLLDTAEVV